MDNVITVYIGIGNFGDRLSQARWCEFYDEVHEAITDHASQVHGVWLSCSASEWQNACWCVEVDDEWVAELREALAQAAGRYGQESIAWAEASTELLAAISPAD